MEIWRLRDDLWVVAGFAAAVGFRGCLWLKYNNNQMPIVDIIKGYVPGSIGRVAQLHSEYYSRHWGFGAYFEAKVAAELAEFISRYDENRDGFWIVSTEGRIEGSITIDGVQSATLGAHLRWFIVSENRQANGLGSRLMEAAIDFCRRREYKRVYLWSFEGLGAAGHLYRKHGFELVEQHTGITWGTRVNEQRFELRLT